VREKGGPADRLTNRFVAAGRGAVDEGVPSRRERKKAPPEGASPSPISDPLINRRGI
jgi:hypothetical protein